MAIFFDVLLVAILLFTVIKHTRLGLACSVLSAGRFFASLILASILCYPIAALFYEIGIPTAISGIVAFIAVFFVFMLFSKLLIKLLSKIKIPVVTKVDKLLGLLLGVILGLIFTSLLSTFIYTVLEARAMISSDADAMSAYYDSYVFKFIYELEIFEFIRNLF